MTQRTDPTSTRLLPPLIDEYGIIATFPGSESSACRSKSAAQWLLKHFTAQACSADALLAAGTRVAIFHP